MNLLKSIITIGLFLFFMTTLFGAEDNYWLKIESKEDLKELKIAPSQKFSSEIKREVYVKELVQDLKYKMFIEASIDSTWSNDLDTLNIFLHIGPVYIIDVDLPEVFTKSKKNNSRYLDKNIFNTIKSIDQQLIYWQENGYPFEFG